MSHFDYWTSQLRSYVFAVVTTCAAALIRTMLQPQLNDECPFSLFYLSVLLTAWFGGTGPALVSLLLGMIAAVHFFIPPEGSLAIAQPSHILSLTIYAGVNLVAMTLFSLVASQRRLAEERASENVLLSESLREADQRKDEFLALLAHELRNPLAPIRNGLSLLARTNYAPEVVENICPVFDRQLSHLVRLVDDLLDVPRFLRGKMRLQVERLDLREVVAVAVEMTTDLIESKSLEFLQHLPTTPVWMQGDVVRLTQLTGNLLSNAAKYTPNQGRIMLQLDQLEDQVRLIVKDNGVGFPASEGERILEPFAQVDTSITREYGGLGIGLAIVKQIAELHHGTIEAKSRGPGLGSCFTVTFRVAAPPTPTGNVDQSSDYNHGMSGSGRTGIAEKLGTDSVSTESLDTAGIKEILIVEDNRDANLMLKDLLQYEGFVVRSAFDGMSGLKLADERVPDAVILDLGLPGMDGYEVAELMRRRCQRSRTLIIALSGWGSCGHREKSAEVGFDLHLVKPVDFDELLAVLQCKQLIV